METENTAKRPLEQATREEQQSKRAKVEEDTAGPGGNSATPAVQVPTDDPPRKVLHPNPLPLPVSKLGLKPEFPDLPPSLALVTGVTSDFVARRGVVGETEVGIIGYAGPKDVTGVRGVIKQRFLDFMVNEISLSGEVLHLKDISKPYEPELEKPKELKKPAEKIQPAPKGESSTAAVDATVENTTGEAIDGEEQSDLPELLRFEPVDKWSTSTTKLLRPHLSDETIVALHRLFVEGRDPPPKTDNGWGARVKKVEGEEEEDAMNLEQSSSGSVTVGSGDSGRGRGQGRDRGRGRGRGRGGRGGAQVGERSWTKDEREVLSQPIAEKEKRAAAHKAIRELFGGVFETSSREIPGSDGQKLVVKWARGSQRKVLDPRDRFRRNLPPYIHFTLQKSNRETTDAMQQLSRALGCHPRDLTTCGTKDKRAVTVQRVCLKRTDRTITSVWRAINGVKSGKRSDKSATQHRGEKGMRIGDLAYSRDLLDLGMLKGNRFTITLRSVDSGKDDEFDRILSSLRDHGFINFYGMQRFGTSSVPTHVTGLQLLKGKWADAIESILSLREGEHPECMVARLAWLEDGDNEKALSLMPRRAVAERCIWEFWTNGNPKEDTLGAISQIPRNLRVMYAHAYQSYVWNLVASQRAKASSTEPMIGDLVYAEEEGDEDDDEVDDNPARSQSTHLKKVKRLTAEDLPNHSIFEIILPLPGWGITYPGGESGELYEKILVADGLDPKNMKRDQREYSLPGGYRKLLHRPKNVTWRHIRYTDPEISLTQSDEDKILDIFPASASDPNGKFEAVQIEFELSPAVYATMALREITREETSTWHQAGLTLSGEDQEYRGSAKKVQGDQEGQGAEVVTAEEVVDKATGLEVGKDQKEETA